MDALYPFTAAHNAILEASACLLAALEPRDVDPVRERSRARDWLDMAEDQLRGLAYPEAHLVIAPPEGSAPFHERRGSPWPAGLQTLEAFRALRTSALLDLDSPALFGANDVRAICTLLEPLSKVPLDGDLRRLNGITEMNLLTPRTERFHRVYNGKLASTRDKLIVHLYDLSAYHGPAGGNAEQIVTVARREFDALQRLQKSPWLPRVTPSLNRMMCLREAFARSSWRLASSRAGRK